MAPSPPPAWRVIHTGSKGRCLVASRALHSGTDVLACYADAWSLFEKQRGSRCAYCLRMPECEKALLVCNTCEAFAYCSRHCQEQDLSEHESECASIAHLDRVPPPTMLMTARLVRRVGVEALTRQDPDKRSLFRALGQLVHHTDKASPVRQKQFLFAANQICGLLVLPPAPADMATIVAKLGGPRFVARLLAQIGCNAFTITDGDAEVLGVGLFLGAVSANHSCDPNCHQIFEGPNIRLRALRPIAPGEELTIGYIDISNTRKLRQEALLEGYGFECACSRCSSLEEQWRETQVVGWACPRRGCLGACVEEPQGAALFRAWRATRDGIVECNESRARVCTACGARLEVNEVHKRQADLEKAEHHRQEFDRLLAHRGSQKADALRDALKEADKICDVYARCLIPHISLRRYEFMTRLVEECIQLQEFGLMIKYGVLSSAGLEAISPRHSPASAYLYANLGKALLYIHEPAQALTYLCKAMQKLEASHGQDHQYMREVGRLLMDAQNTTGRKK